MADSNKPIVPGGDTVGTVGEIYLSKNGKTYECVAVIDNTTVTPNGETIPRVEYVWVCTDDGAGGGAFPFDVSDAEPITISRTKEELIAAIDAGKTPIGYWRHTQSNGTVIRLFHFVKRFDVANGANLTFYFSDKTSSGVLDIKADGTIKRTYQNNDSGGASSSANFTFTITPVDGQVSPNLSVTRTEMLAALDAGKTLLGYWTEIRTILETTDTIKHEFRLESVSGTGASRGLAFVNYEQFYKSTLYVNGNDTVSFVDKEVLPAPMTKTEAMTQSVGMDNDGRLWTEPGASGGGVTTLHINVTAVSQDTLQATFTADKTPSEMQQAAITGPIWCVITFAAGIAEDNPVTYGLPPAWYGSKPAFGYGVVPGHKENGNNDIRYAVRSGTDSTWLIEPRAFGS